MPKLKLKRGSFDTLVRTYYPDRTKKRKSVYGYLATYHGIAIGIYAESARSWHAILLESGLSFAHADKKCELLDTLENDERLLEEIRPIIKRDWYAESVKAFQDAERIETYADS